MSIKKVIEGVSIECMVGNIVAQHGISVIVNAANAQLRRGGGVAGAIHGAAGPGLEKECRPLAPIKTGVAVITSGHNLPNPHVIHCLGPVYGVDKPEDVLLGDCYRNALNLCEENGLESIAFPAISTGIVGYPPAEAVEVALKKVLELAPTLKSVKLIRFVLFGESDLRVYEEAFSRFL
jgi:O-acetyl-ADP-ribose deacetylase (regulator of RNase III)